MPRRTRWVAWLLFGLSAAFALKCATPTALTVTVYSELTCTRGSAVVLVGASTLGEIVGKAPSSVSATCDADGRIGSVVILPAASKDEALAFAVMQRADGQPAEGCLDPAQSNGCIVAKRQLRFARHFQSDMRIDMRLSCLGVLCATDETCLKGTCVAAQTSCGASCDEGTFDVKQDGGISAKDAQVDDVRVADTGPSGFPDASGPPTAYHDVTDAALWERFDLAPLGGASAFSGGVFDGRYVYFSPGFTGGHERIVRYDTRASFAASTSWLTHAAGVPDWGGAVFDGQFVYFLSYGANLILRYDTTVSSETPQAWISVSTNFIGVPGSPSGVFDGRYLYAATNRPSTTTPAVVSRLVTRGTFASAASWSHFDVTATLPAPGLSAMFLGSYDGRHIYFTPDDFGSIAVRYDTRSPFGAKGSWESVDLLPLRSES